MPAGPPAGRGRLLVFTRTTGYRHESIPDGVRAVSALAEADGLSVHHTEDHRVFTPEELRGYELVVWLSTSGEVLEPAGRAALAAWLAAGGGFAGIHAASTSEYGWPDYEDIVGAWFDRHPDVQTGTIHVEDREHPSTAALPATWTHCDEWYDFRRNPRGRVHVLATVDESTYEGGGMGADHPVAWCGRYGQGRTWYTSLGHASETYDDELFLAHVQGGLRSVRRA